MIGTTRGFAQPEENPAANQKGKELGANASFFPLKKIALES